MGGRECRYRVVRWREKGVGVGIWDVGKRRDGRKDGEGGSED